MIALFKALHVAGVALWCAGLLALPLMLARGEMSRSRGGYRRLRRYTHHAYTYLVTPAAVIAVAAGTVLIFLRETWTVWFYAKLLFVGLLVVLHAWVGHIVLLMGERPGEHPRARAPLVLGSGIAVITAILVLVLWKPPVGDQLFPRWLLEPLGRPSPLDWVAPEQPRQPAADPGSPQPIQSGYLSWSSVIPIW